MTRTKTILIAASAATVTLGLILMVAHGHLSGGRPGPFQMALLFLLLPAEWLGEACSSYSVFLIVGFLEFFYPYWLGLRIWNARKQV